MVRRKQQAEEKKLSQRNKREIREMLLVHLNTWSVSESGKTELNEEVTGQVTIPNLIENNKHGYKK